MKILKKYFSCSYLIVIINLFMLFNVSYLAALDELVDWDHDSFGYENALKVSKENNTPLIVFFSLESDPLCKKLCEDYFLQYDVNNFLQEFQKVDINLEGDDSEIELAKTYNIEKKPTLMILFPFADADPVKTSPFLKERNMTPEEFVINLKNLFSITYNNIGFSFYEKKDYEKAAEYYEFSIKYNPERAYNFFALASVYHARTIKEEDMKYYRKAEEYYKKALNLDPEFEECKEELKKLYENKNKLKIQEQ